MISTRSCWAVICIYCSRVGVVQFPVVWLAGAREPHACNPVAYEPELDEPDICEADGLGACEPDAARCEPSCGYEGHCRVDCDPLPPRLLPLEVLRPHPVFGGLVGPVEQGAPSGGPLPLPGKILC